MDDDQLLWRGSLHNPVARSETEIVVASQAGTEERNAKRTRLSDCWIRVSHKLYLFREDRAHLDPGVNPRDIPALEHLHYSLSSPGY